MADKGLKSNVVGLFGGTMLGISSVAPAYTSAITIGLLAAAVGAKTPFVFIAGFLPMFFAAYAYREFNRIMPDAGTSFTWTSKAFGPYIGWLGGWAAVIMRARQPEFFRGETLIHESAHAMRPHEHLVK